jgi:hypothetical protein
MKKVLIGAFLLIGSFALTQKSEAQIRFGFNINVGQQPPWRVPGYNYVEYYYLPDIDAYYYVPRRQFVYMNNGQWVFSSSLPYRYRNYDLYRGNKIVVNRHNAYLNHDDDMRRYGRRYDYDQRTNRDRRDYDRDRRHDRNRRD